MVSIGEKLIMLRKEFKYTQNQVSDMLEIARSTYANYERNYNEPDLKMLVKLSNLYDVSLDYLLGKTSIRNLNYKPKELRDLMDEIEYTLNGKLATEEDRLRMNKLIEFLYFDIDISEKK